MIRRTSFAALVLSVAAAAQTYQEPYRPQFHFSPKVNWTNDPNGLVYFEGEYHLFFQYNPFGDKWGHMSWGHAVSRDLVHWQELKVALPEADGVMIFTGSVVVDSANTSGFCRDSKPCMVAIYTGAQLQAKPPRQAQYIAYSNDRGRTWTKYDKNPVLDLHMEDFRDPGVFWSKQSKRWVMAVSLPNDHKVAIYASPDLKAWKEVSQFGPEGATGGQWECPDLFELPVDGNATQTRWVLKVGLNPGGLQGGSGEQYFIGKFDGTRFVNDNKPDLQLWTDYGKDCYCALTFNNMPAGHPQAMLGWMSNWQYADKVPTHPWRGQMTVPRELALKTFPGGLRLVQKPVASLAQLRGRKVMGAGGELKLDGESLLIEASLNPGVAGESGWKLLTDGGAYTVIGYDAAKKEIFVDRSHTSTTSFEKDFPARTAAPLDLRGGPLKVQILVDRNSIEVFAGDGRVAITSLVFATKPSKLVAFGGAQNASAYWPLASIWTTAATRRTSR